MVLPGNVERLDEADLQALNTLALPSRVATLLRVEDEQGVECAVAHAGSVNRELLVLGEGSNLILSPALDVVMVQLLNKGIYDVQQGGDDVVFTVGAGRDWHSLVVETLQRGWYGLENLALIPGTVGAAPVQNIGAYGVELARFVESVRVYDLRRACWHDVDNQRCDFGYRDSTFRHPGGQRYVITAVTFRLHKRPRVECQYAALAAQLPARGVTPQDVFQAVVAIRQRKLPAPDQLPNAGSFFKNPMVTARCYRDLVARYPKMVGYPQASGEVKLAAGWLIERAGYKGHCRVSQARGARVGMHSEQALVLVNYSGAAADDVLSYADEVAGAVYSLFGVSLEREPMWIQRDGRRA